MTQTIYYILLSNNTDMRDSILCKVKAANKDQAADKAYNHYNKNKFSIGYIMTVKEMINKNQSRSWAHDLG